MATAPAMMLLQLTTMKPGRHELVTETLHGFHHATCHACNSLERQALKAQGLICNSSVREPQYLGSMTPAPDMAKSGNTLLEQPKPHQETPEAPVRRIEQAQNVAR
jgi:hypothetical protein